MLLRAQGPETDAHTAQIADEQPDALLESSFPAQPIEGLNEPEVYATSVASQGPKANEQPDALLESSAAAQPTQGLNKPEEHATSVASQGPKANEQPQEDISSSSGPKTRGPVVLDEDMLSKLGSQKAGIDVRLQCWDFPGQEEYALLNQLHFSERAIYLVFLDLTGQLEDEWRHLSFWLWKIVRFSTEKDAWPPILLIGTKAGARNRCVTALELQKRLEDLQSRVPRLKEQLQPHPADLGSKCTKCPWLFPIENKGMQLQRMALQFVSPRDLWEAEKSDGSVVPRFVGLQAETFPLTWLRAHDLLTPLGSGLRQEFDMARRLTKLPLDLVQLLRMGLSHGILEMKYKKGVGFISGHLKNNCQHSTLANGHRNPTGDAGEGGRVPFQNFAEGASISIRTINMPGLCKILAEEAQVAKLSSPKPVEAI
jgi:GTPase SAR1 family protein